MTTGTIRTHSQARAAPGGTDSINRLGDCHRDTLRMLAELEMLVARLERTGLDPHAQIVAAAIEQHFSATLHHHHEDEERQIFPALAASGDAGTLDIIARLKQDHAWMQMNWRELWPHVNAIACGHSWYDLDVLREGVEIISALEREHIELEETLVYPLFREMAHAAQRQQTDGDARASRRAEAIRLLHGESGVGKLSSYRR